MKFKELQKQLNCWKKTSKKELENVDFSDCNTWDWREYVTDSEKLNWKNFSHTVRLVIFVKSQQIADMQPDDF